MGSCNDDGNLSPQPLEDPQAVDQIRAELNLPPKARDGVPSLPLKPGSLRRPDRSSTIERSDRHLARSR